MISAFQYKVIWADNVYDLEEDVNRHLSTGIWILQGGISCTERGDTQVMFCQAITKTIYEGEL